MTALVCEKNSFKNSEGNYVYMLVLATKDSKGNIRIMRKQDKDGKWGIKNNLVDADVFDKVYVGKCYKFGMALKEGSFTASIVSVDSAVPTL